MAGLSSIRTNTKVFLGNLRKGQLPAPLVWTLALGLSLFTALVIYKKGVMGGGLLIGAAIGIPTILAIVAYPRFGVMSLLIWSFVVNFISNFTAEGTPVGTTMDLLEYLLIAGFFLKLKYKRDWSVFKNPIAYLVIAWVSYNIMQVANPWAESKLAWVYTVRTVAVVMLMYFIFVYQIDDFKFAKRLIKTFMLLTLIGAIYGYAQEINGYFPYEWTVLRRNPLTMHLNFQAGHWRKFSIYADPVTFAYNMVFGSAICMAMLFGDRSAGKKALLVFLILLFMVVSLYSGTRAGFVLLPACIAMLVILYFNKRVLAVSAVMAVVFVVIIFMPTSNGIIKRFQSAFRPSEDASFNERTKNQAFIKPFIQSHPIGAGLGSVGVWGQKFSPNSPIANFPPDSTYVRIGVELGPIGLILFCTLLFTAIKTGINNFYLIKDPEMKNYTLAMVLVLFAIAIGSYPQQSIVQFPSNILFYLCIALINVLKRLDDQQQLSLHSAKKPQLQAAV